MQANAGRPGTIVIDPAAPYGYTRPADLQQQFEQAAAALLASDGWSGGGTRELVADLALEGGGVKGIGIVGAVSALAEAGYRFQRVAGTSAGAIAAALIAAISKKGDPMTTLQGYLDNLTFTEFMPQGKVHAFLDHHFGNAGEVLSSAEVLTHKMGVYDGAYLFTWLEPIMHDLGVHTFADLKITPEEDPGMSLPESHRYRLVVHTSDITRGQLVHLPWDYGYYGQDRDTQDVVGAVRASMSIPFFFEPVTFTALPAEVTVPSPGGGSVSTHYEGGTVTWVDGGMLRNFPIDAFDREDGGEPRWPTIGVKLSSLQTRDPVDPGGGERLRRGTGLPAHDDGRMGRLQRRRRDGRPHHLRGQRRDLDHGLRPDDRGNATSSSSTASRAATSFVIEMGAGAGSRAGARRASSRALPATR